MNEFSLPFTGAITLYQRLATRDPLTPGTGPIWLDNVNCGLNANRLIDCPRSNAIGVHNCNHNEDAGVRCEPIGFRGKEIIIWLTITGI